MLMKITKWKQVENWFIEIFRFKPLNNPSITVNALHKVLKTKYVFHLMM